MGNIIVDTLIDLVKIIPFLFIAFIIMEYLEHKVKSKSDKLKNNKAGPIIGSLLGVIPQCGFSVMGTNLFSSRVITMGTLIAIYLSTSDEMLPILITGGASFKTIMMILLIKVVVGIIFGLLIDLIYKNKREENFEICHDDDCHCDDGIIKSSLIHTLKISFFILITTFVLNTLIYYLGSERIASIVKTNSLFGPFLASLVGLIPNCCASVIITELYLNGVITSGMLIGGLLTGAGIGLLVLFRVNKNIKENIIILTSLYLIGSFVGLLIDLIGISI